MLSGPELGAALRVAMQRKGVRQKDVAAEFGITQPSVHEWLKFGRIDKKHISHLIEYFADVADASHWGLADDLAPSVAPADAAPWPFPRITQRQWRSLTERQRGAIEDAAVAKMRELLAERPRESGEGGTQDVHRGPVQKAA